MVAARKSWRARVYQSFTSRLFASSIELSALIQDLMEQRCAKVFVAVYFTTRSDQDIGGDGQPAQTPLGALVASNWPFVAVGDDHHEVNVAVLGGRAPGMRAKQVNLLRQEFSLQPLNGLVQQVRLARFHAGDTSIAAADCKGL